MHRLATDLGLTGFVGNDALAVFAEVQGPSERLAEFERRIPLDAPPLAVITSIAREQLPPLPESGFRIVASEGGAGARTLVSPDIATCDKCVAELFDPSDHRYRHPFITCTDCGPRLTIIQDLPYDRPVTTMAGFTMCPRCHREYHDPADRRFHAQPVACPDCGPVLWFEQDGRRVDGSDAALAAAQRAIADGLILAVKGVGGYHLACRADDAAAIERLRARKAREHKPFAVLARDLEVAARLVDLDRGGARVLASPARPIVLLPRRAGAPVDESVAPANPLLGVLLPYTPVHHLLLAKVPGASLEPPDVLVLTSANLSEEPLCFDDSDAAARLPLLADALLTHDRPIHVPCDDSVVRVIGDHELPVRRSRGYAPLPVRLPRPLPPTLAVGAELKNTCCLIDGDNAFCSAHVGDMANLATLRAFERTVDQLTTLHRLTPEVLAADAHPAYLTNDWAQRHSGEPGEPGLRLVQHHHAHVVSLLAEHGRIGRPIIGIAFDGTGYGDDASVWGGEILLLGSDSSRYLRAGHLAPITLPGGDAAVRNPCRMALAYLDAAGVAWDDDLPPVAACQPAERAAVRSQLASGVGTVRCTSMGRLFDAVSALLGVRQRVGYEAQAAIELENLAVLAEVSATAEGVRLSLPVDAAGLIEHRPLIQSLVAGVRRGVPAANQAYGFHIAVAEAVAECARRITEATGVRLAGLTGGVFGNVLLSRLCRQRLEDRGLEVLTHRVVPPNDGGLSLGQAVIAALAAESEQTGPSEQHGAAAQRAEAEGDDDVR